MLPAAELPDGDGAAAEPGLAEAARKLFARPARFRMGIARLDQLPPAGPPEVAVAGRSNVGKSSLINALTGQGELARTSNTPGRTQEINLFDLDRGRLTLVDLPGYGFAQAPKEVVARWTALVFAYLRGRPSLQRVCLLLDSRHGVKKVDEEVMDLLARAAVPFQPVLTKCDLVRPAELEALLHEVTMLCRKRPAAIPEPIATSSRRRHGLDELRTALASLALPPETQG